MAELDNEEAGNGEAAVKEEAQRTLQEEAASQRSETRRLLELAETREHREQQETETHAEELSNSEERIKLTLQFQNDIKEQPTKRRRLEDNEKTTSGAP